MGEPRGLQSPRRNGYAGSTPARPAGEPACQAPRSDQVVELVDTQHSERWARGHWEFNSPPGHSSLTSLSMGCSSRPKGLFRATGVNPMVFGTRVALGWVARSESASGVGNARCVGGMGMPGLRSMPRVAHAESPDGGGNACAGAGGTPGGSEGLGVSHARRRLRASHLGAMDFFPSGKPPRRFFLESPRTCDFLGCLFLQNAHGGRPNQKPATAATPG